MIDKRVNKPRSYLPPMVVVLDVRLPRRIVIREILPVLERGPRQKQRALIKFLNGKPTLSTKKKIDYCDNLGDEELIQEVALRQKRYWGGKICIFFFQTVILLINEVGFYIRINYRYDRGGSRVFLYRKQTVGRKCRVS